MMGGTCAEKDQDKRGVINLFAQFCPGKPKQGKGPVEYKGARTKRKIWNWSGGDRQLVSIYIYFHANQVVPPQCYPREIRPYEGIINHHHPLIRPYFLRGGTLRFA